MDDLLWNCGCEAGRCLDPAHHDFWMPENWPGGRAPVRWTYSDRSAEREAGEQFASDGCGVQLWVPDCCVGSDILAGNLWWSSYPAAINSVEQIRLWTRLEAETQAERDEILDARDDLAETQESGMAVPA